MIRYKPANQLSIEEFETPFDIRVCSENRWVKLSKQIPWDELASIYYKSMCSDHGAPGIDARIVIGAMVIKHIEKLDDRGTVQAIQENPFMQYFLGLSNFTYKEVFDPSLFVTIRKRLGVEEFDKMNQVLISKALGETIKGEETGSDDDKSKGGTPSPPKNKGKLQMDATVADSYIKYPTDLDLLNDSREKAEELIDLLAKELGLKKKPRTYRRVARRDFLLVSKKKNKSKKEVRKGIRQQLGYLKRDIKSLYRLLDQCKSGRQMFTRQELKYFYVIQHIYRQQEEMYKGKKHSVDNRIVSIYQPHVRPIVRGKAKAKVEFGAKISVGLENGYARLEHLGWEAFNEGGDLKLQVGNYHRLHGHYPELVQVDGIYLNRENRSWLKEHGIRHTGRPLGRPPKEELSYYQKRKRKKENADRNQIEGKFGQGKNGYNLNKIRAKLQETSESWIAAIFFVMNLKRFSKDFLSPFVFLYFYLKFLKKYSMKNVSGSYAQYLAYIPA
jgi:IS5 family transposase